MAIRRFILITEGDVFMQLQFDDESQGQKSQGWAAGLLSSPTIIEVTDQPEVVPGWTWDGVQFNQPQ
jgi:hypothetical protein